MLEASIGMPGLVFLDSSDGLLGDFSVVNEAKMGLGVGEALECWYVELKKTLVSGTQSKKCMMNNGDSLGGLSIASLLFRFLRADLVFCAS